VKDRLGKINISTDFLLEYDSVKVLFNSFIPLRIDQLDIHSYTYMGYSPEFRKVIVGEEIPYYTGVFTKSSDDGKISVKFGEVNNETN
jgi:hypothetical protein